MRRVPSSIFCLVTGIGDADVLRGAESFAGDGNYVRLVQQPGGQFGRV